MVNDHLQIDKNTPSFYEMKKEQEDNQSKHVSNKYYDKNSSFSSLTFSNSSSVCFLGGFYLFFIE
jgi:hypothetical protein